MNSNMQLLSFLVSLFYGIIFYYLTIINFKLIEKLKKYLKHIITVIFVLDMIIIYIIIFYNLNKGYFHIYFLLMVIFGYFVGFITNKRIFSKINVNKLLRRWKKIFFMLVFEMNRVEIWLKLRKLAEKKKNVFF